MTAAAGAALPEPASSPLSGPSAPWLIAIAGFLAMYVPIWWWASGTIWKGEEHGHAPLVLAVIVWLFWRIREPILASARTGGARWGAPVFALGLLLYTAGRAFQISILEFASQPFVACGVLLLIGGRAAARAAWFPLLYFAFMVPLPGPIVDAVTGPLKQWISVLVVELLYHVGYPISRNGVMISIGQYQLLVADACSGLYSMYSLSALGTLFLYVVARRSVAHNAVMLAAILPIAFIANIVRVSVLILITYHFGDEAGQGFLHGAAGLVLMLVALSALIALDGALARVISPARDDRLAPPEAGAAHAPAMGAEPS